MKRFMGQEVKINRKRGPNLPSLAEGQRLRMLLKENTSRYEKIIHLNEQIIRTKSISSAKAWYTLDLQATSQQDHKKKCMPTSTKNSDISRRANFSKLLDFQALHSLQIYIYISFKSNRCKTMIDSELKFSREITVVPTLGSVWLLTQPRWQKWSMVHGVGYISPYLSIKIELFSKTIFYSRNALRLWSRFRECGLINVIVLRLRKILSHRAAKSNLLCEVHE